MTGGAHMWDLRKAMLFTPRGFKYAVWARKISCLAEIRADCFAALRTARELDDEQNDAEAVDADAKDELASG